MKLVSPPVDTNTMSQVGGDVSLARDSPAEQVVSSVINQLQQQHQQQQNQQQQEEDDQVMVATERDLAEDAQWKRIQQNTFTRWANEHLKTVDKYIGSLETDLSDGLMLIALIEVLSGKKLPKHNKKPVFRSQKLENVSVALRFLERDEGIRIVNIGKSIYFTLLSPVHLTITTRSGKVNFFPHLFERDEIVAPPCFRVITPQSRSIRRVIHLPLPTSPYVITTRRKLKIFISPTNKKPQTTTALVLCLYISHTVVFPYIHSTTIQSFRLCHQ